jgi:aldehyde dehydrogenase (NAD(P)+)
MTTVANAPVLQPGDGLAAEDRDRLDRATGELQVGVRRWAALSLADRAALLDEVQAATAGVAELWMRTACEIKGIDIDSPYSGEEWISGPYAMLTGVYALAHSVRALTAGQSPVDAKALGTAPGGRVAVRVLPQSSQEWTLLNGFSADVWIKPGLSAETVRRDAGLGQLNPTESGGVGLVLGAGNITSIAPLDVLYELFSANRVVILKLNPILGRMMNVLTAAMWPLIREGFLRIVQGGIAEGAYLTGHPGIAHVHITGSAASHDAIVWGTGDEAARRKAANDPRLTVPITSELGGVAPVIVVPGEWTKADLKFQAEHVATMRLHNSGHNCIAAQVVILSANWPQRDAFVQEIRRAMNSVPARGTWYPNSAARLREQGEKFSSVERLGPDGQRLLVDLGPASEVSSVETTESFAPLLGIVSVPGTGEEFLRGAIAHANDRLTGTLGANLLIAPTEQKAMGARLDELLVDLRYGTIGVNAWSAVGFLTPAATWGAFPGADLADVSSGIGVVHNALLLDDVERTVVRGPFRPFPRSVLAGQFSLFPKPPWFVTARSAGKTGRKLTAYAGDPGWTGLPGVFVAAFRA